MDIFFFGFCVMCMCDQSVRIHLVLGFALAATFWRRSPIRHERWMRQRCVYGIYAPCREKREYTKWRVVYGCAPDAQCM